MTRRRLPLVLVLVVACFQCHISSRYQSSFRFDTWDMIQSVFVRSPSSPDSDVFRLVPLLNGSDSSAPLFSARNVPAPWPLVDGPFRNAGPLDVSIGQWLSAEGEGSFLSDDDDGALEIAFQHLIPRGRYSLWQCRVEILDARGLAECPVRSSPILLDALDPPTMLFTADANGVAHIRVTAGAFDPLPERKRVVLHLMYHSERMPPAGTPSAYQIGRTMFPQLRAVLSQSPPRSWLEYFPPMALWGLLIGYALALNARFRTSPFKSREA